MADLTTAAGALAAVNDKKTSEDDLATIASDYPDLRYLVAAHPNAYPELLDWLWQYGGDDARRMINRRDEARAAAAKTAPGSSTAAEQSTRPAAPSPGEDAPRHRGALYAGIALIVIALILALVFFGVPGTGIKGVLDRYGTGTAVPSTQVPTSATAPTSATSTGPVSSSSSSNATATSSAPTTQTSSVPPQRFANYHNSRFGFSVDYPTAMTADPAPANGDGQVWKSSHGNVTFTATGINNTSNDAKRLVTSDLASLTPSGAKITYQDGGQGTDYYWGVVSGYSSGGARSFYAYEAVGAGSGVRITWTWDTSATWVQDWVSHCYSTVKPGDRTKAH